LIGAIRAIDPRVLLNLDQFRRCPENFCVLFGMKQENLVARPEGIELVVAYMFDKSLFHAPD